MLSSLPLIQPRDAHTLWYTSSSSSGTAWPHNSGSGGDLSQGNQTHGGLVGGDAFIAGGAHDHTGGNARTSFNASSSGPHNTARSSATLNNPLAALRAQENFIAARKTHIARFGACWIRPPGVGKTYQAAMDEEAEREEAARLAERELAMMEEEAADEEGMGEDEEGEWEDEDGEMADGATGPGPGAAVVRGVPTATNMRVAGPGAGREGRMTAEVVEGMEEADEDEGEEMGERDLDDEVPEAEDGGYEHTDTELEDDDEDGDEDEGEGEDEDDSEEMSMQHDSAPVTLTPPAAPTLGTAARTQRTSTSAQSYDGATDLGLGGETEGEESGMVFSSPLGFGMGSIVGGDRGSGGSGVVRPSTSDVSASRRGGRLRRS
ncbi:MAG: hypothetical protein M1838_000036 [Thelocarpon superellum]|nr:MAG: hypothetical protein M1838_000036 [Thelocarpon superellum]